MRELFEAAYDQVNTCKYAEQGKDHHKIGMFRGRPLVEFFAKKHPYEDGSAHTESYIGILDIAFYRFDGRILIVIRILLL